MSQNLSLEGHKHMKKLNPMDLFDLSSELNEEETIVRDTVARFVDSEVIPIIGECFEHGRFPSELVPQVAELASIPFATA